MAHTKGPWKCEPSNAPDCKSVWNVFAPDLDYQRTERVVAKVYGYRHMSGEADAQLIAAAPDMYDVLKAYEKADEHFADCDHCCAAEPCSDYLELAGEAQRLRVAALAKADGQAL